MHYWKERKKVPAKERREAIEFEVEKMQKEQQVLHEPAFDIIKFLQSKGFSIATKIMEEDTTGMLFVDDEEFIPNTSTHKLIVINSLLQNKSNYIQRRRFIIAHEYAHYILHKKDQIQFAHRDTSKKDTDQEKEADFFARCLLMPNDLIKQLLEMSFVEKLSLDSKVMLVSRVFNVTVKKADQRLKEDFGLI